MILKTFEKISSYLFPRSDMEYSLKVLSQASFSPGGLRIIHKLQQHGYQAFFVGGCVRDFLFGKQPKDFDIVTDARPKQITALFPNAIIIGKRFTLVHIRWKDELLEVATFRAHSDDQSNLNPSILSKDNTYGTLQDDLIRRDFTINALYYDPFAHKLIDHSHGLQDIYQRTVRSIGTDHVRFTEDPVRMIRAVRYAAKLNLTLSPEIILSMREKSLLLAHIPKARLYEEFLKCFNNPSNEAVYNLMTEHKLIRHLVPKNLVEPGFRKSSRTMLRRLMTLDPLKEHLPSLIILCFIAPYWATKKHPQPQDLESIFRAFSHFISIPRHIDIAIREILLNISPSQEEHYRYKMLPKMKIFKNIAHSLTKGYLKIHR